MKIPLVTLLGSSVGALGITHYGADVWHALFSPRMLEGSKAG